MVSSLPRSLNDTLVYFAKYNYPLSVDELWYWQHGTTYSKRTIAKFYKLISKSKLWKVRLQRAGYSQVKWELAKVIGEELKKVPDIQAVYVTGALAMDNCPKDDDVDFMIVTSPNALWTVRFKVNLVFNSWRRKPNLRPRSNQPCFNLWLDCDHLNISPHDYYRAHEILQAKILWDRGGVQARFIQRNKWLKRFLPVAYGQHLKRVKPKFNRHPYSPWSLLINSLFFLAQYLYMRPKMTTERVGLGYAYFHPKILRGA